MLVMVKTCRREMNFVLQFLIPGNVAPRSCSHYILVYIGTHKEEHEI